MKTETVKCDHCGADLSETGKSGATRTVVMAEPIPNNSGMSTLMDLKQFPLKPMHFCGLNCLHGWAVEGAQEAREDLESEIAQRDERIEELEVKAQHAYADGMRDAEIMGDTR